MSTTAPEFASPVTTSLSELLSLQSQAVLVTSRKRRTAAKQQGAAPSKHFGRGLDFAEVREYHAGDEVRMMDWNVTARTGKAHIKLFMEERERPVLFVVDQTPTMRFGTRGMFKSAMAARLAALLAWCALIDGDRIGGVVAFPEQLQRIKPAGQRRGLLRLFQALITDTAGRVNSESLSSEQTFLQALQHARTLAPAGSRLVLISDFQTLNASVEQEIIGLLQRFEITAICVQDVLENALPKRGVLPVKGKAQSGPAQALNTSSDAQKSHTVRAEENRAAINRLFLKGGHVVTHIQSHEPLIESAMRAWFGIRFTPFDKVGPNG